MRQVAPHADQVRDERGRADGGHAERRPSRRGGGAQRDDAERSRRPRALVRVARLSGIASGIDSASASHAAGDASVGMRQSPRGDSEPPEPTFGRVGHAVALELVGEEAAQEDEQPAADLARARSGRRRRQRHARDAARAEAEAEEVVEEEVVQLVGADEVLGALHDLAVGARPQQLGADRRVEHLAQRRLRPRGSSRKTASAAQRISSEMSVFGTPALTP